MSELAESASEVLYNMGRLQMYEGQNTGGIAKVLSFLKISETGGQKGNDAYYPLVFRVDNNQPVMYAVGFDGYLYPVNMLPNTGKKQVMSVNALSLPGKGGD